MVPLLAGAYWTYPTWDDGLFWFQWNELGPDIWNTVSQERPLLGFILNRLGHLGLLPQVPIILFVFTWLGTGLVTRGFWNALFPRAPNFALVAAALAMSPALIQTQLILVYPIISGHLGSVICFAVCLAVARVRRQQLPWVALAIGAPLVFASNVLSEYALLATVVGSLALWLGVEIADPVTRTVRRNALGILCVAAILGYVVYHATASAAARPGIRPEIQLAEQGGRRLLEMPIRLPFALWTGVLGEFFRGVGEITFFSGSIVGLGYGGLWAAGAGALLRRQRRRGADYQESVVAGRRTPVALLAALAVGLAAIILMTNSPQQNIASRVWQPLFPLAICLTVWVLVGIIRPRFQRALMIFCVFLSAYLCANSAAAARKIRIKTDALAARIHERLSPTGLTVALFASYPTNTYVGSPIARPTELSARLSRNWPEADRKRFWAGATDWAPLKEHVPEFAGTCGRVPTVDSEVAGWVRRGPVERLLWVSFTPDGEYQIAEGQPR